MEFNAEGRLCSNSDAILPIAEAVVVPLCVLLPPLPCTGLLVCGAPASERSTMATSRAAPALPDLLCVAWGYVSRGGGRLCTKHHHTDMQVVQSTTQNTPPNTPHYSHPTKHTHTHNTPPHIPLVYPVSNPPPFVPPPPPPVPSTSQPTNPAAPHPTAPYHAAVQATQ